VRSREERAIAILSRQQQLILVIIIAILLFAFCYPEAYYYEKFLGWTEVLKNLLEFFTKFLNSKKLKIQDLNSLKIALRSFNSYSHPK
jgi:hypothetical protein